MYWDGYTSSVIERPSFLPKVTSCLSPVFVTGFLYKLLPRATAKKLNEKASLYEGHGFSCQPCRKLPMLDGFRSR